MIKFNIFEIDFGLGKIEYNDFDLNFSEPLKNQLDNLKEDLLQVSYPNGLLLDIGWFPSFDENGKFQIRAIENYDWETPIFYLEARNVEDLQLAIMNAISRCTGP